MQQLRRLFDEVRIHTGYDLKKLVRIVICKDEREFLSIRNRMKKRNYRLPPESDNILALYFSDDRYIAVSPSVKPNTTSFSMVVLHELGHHLISHEIPPDVVRKLRRMATRKRGEIEMAYASIGRGMPWNIEERLCDLFSFAIHPHVQRGTSLMRKTSRKILESILI